MTSERLFRTGSHRTALIVAHPGHELLLHHWLERAQPVVFVLTDGSGGGDAGRIEHSRCVIEAAGASCGAVFGAAPDKAWYRSILRREPALLHGVIEEITRACAAHRISSLVCDSVELFNPVHDLANVVGHAVAERLHASVFTYPIEAPDAADARSRVLRVPLDEDAFARKAEAVAAYEPLAPERQGYELLINRGYEVLVEDFPAFGWPAELPQEPYYEIFGKRRLGQGRYASLITYAEHVRPLALAFSIQAEAA